MMTTAHSETVTVGKSGQIVRGRRFHHKTNDSTPISFRAEHAQSWQFRHSLQPVSQKIDIVLKNFSAPDPFDIIDRGSQSDRAGDVRRARFETVRRFFE